MISDPGIYGPAGAFGIFLLHLMRDRKPRRQPTMTPPPPPIGESDELREQLRWLEQANERDRELLRKAFSSDPSEREEFDQMRAAVLRERAEAAALQVDRDLLQALEVLGLSRSDLAHPARLKKAYAAKVKRAHPDRGGTAAELRDVLAAWERVSRRDR